MKTLNSPKRLVSVPLLVLMLALSGNTLVINRAGAEQSGSLGEDILSLDANFTFSGTFEPTPIDTNKDGVRAELAREQVSGDLKGAHAGKLERIKLTAHTALIEYTLLNPATDANTSCFRVNEHDFSVEENAYKGPLAQLIRPIRDPVVNPSSSSYGAEEWAAVYRLETGELIFAQTTGLQICVENVKPPESLVPLCHVRSSEKIVGGTGRFKHATGEVDFTAIAPAYTADAPIFNEEGVLDLSKPIPTFSFGPIYGAGRMSVKVPITDVR